MMTMMHSTQNTMILNKSLNLHNTTNSIQNTFQWKIIFKARGYFKRKIAEGLLIQIHKSFLNKQVECYISKLFPKGVA